MNRKTLVIVSRTTLVMLLIAAVVMLGLGLASLVLVDPPEVSGWLRYVFGRVFGVVAVSMAAVLGTPAAIGLWAMAGARAEDAVPALSETVRRILAGIAIAAIAATVVVCLVSGSALAVLNLGLIGLVALASIGLAGAAAYSPHRVRAILSGVALLVVAAGTLWVLVRGFLATPG